jgi:mono/diheme cytochrome c family protein
MRRTLTCAAGAALLTLGASGIRAQWTAPEEKRRMQNPVARTADSVQAGRMLFLESCATCHGAGGAGDGPGSRILESPIPNLADASWAADRTDGEWFYKVATGKDPMIGYEDFFEEVEMWHLVNFMRNLTLEETVEVAQADADLVPESAPMAESAPATEAFGDEASAATEADESEHEAAGAHADPGTAGGPVEFDPRGITNYTSTQAKGPLALALLFSVLMGAVFVAFQRMVPAPPAPEPKADDHGHGH